MLTKLQQMPGRVGILGSISGWLSTDLLRDSQIAAALLAALVSLCSFIIIAPKAWKQLADWRDSLRLWWFLRSH